MLAMALETFRGEAAEVCLLQEGSENQARRITVGPAEHLEIMRPLAASVGEELAALIAADPAARIITPETVGGALAAHLRRLGAREAMLASLPGEKRLLGAMLMVNRTGTGGRFGRDDVKLFETLGRQTGAALGQDRLGAQVSELRDLQAHLEFQAFHDPLTGLANRLLFMDRVEHTLQRRNGNAVVLYVDLDDFKPINDTYGHEAGDAVLTAAGERLRKSLRTADTAARLGGDAFAVLLVDIAEEHIGVVADRIISNLLRPLEFEGRLLDVKASLGVAAANSGSGVGADELVRNADVAMYVSKHGGKGRLSHYEAA
jgi:diguanylate cyclase (GGDEF)-like protein